MRNAAAQQHSMLQVASAAASPVCSACSSQISLQITRHLPLRRRPRLHLSAANTEPRLFPTHQTHIVTSGERHANSRPACKAAQEHKTNHTWMPDMHHTVGLSRTSWPGGCWSGSVLDGSRDSVSFSSCGSVLPSLPTYVPSSRNKSPTQDCRQVVPPQPCTFAPCRYCSSGCAHLHQVGERLRADVGDARAHVVHRHHLCKCPRGVEFSTCFMNSLASTRAENMRSDMHGPDVCGCVQS